MSRRARPAAEKRPAPGFSVRFVSNEEEAELRAIAKRRGRPLGTLMKAAVMFLEHPTRALRELLGKVARPRRAPGPVEDPNQLALFEPHPCPKPELALPKANRLKGKPQ